MCSSDLRLSQFQNHLQNVVVDVLPQEIEKLQSKVGQLDSENEDQYNELLKHQQLLDKLAPGREGGTPQGQPMPPAPLPTKPPAKPPTSSTPAGDAIPPAKLPTSSTPAGDAIARQQEKYNARRLAQTQGFNFIDLEEPETVEESRFMRLVKWATK